MLIKRLFSIALSTNALLACTLAAAAPETSPTRDDLRAQAEQMSQADIERYRRSQGTREQKTRDCFERYYGFRNLHAHRAAPAAIDAAHRPAQACLDALYALGERHPLVLYKRGNLLRLAGQCEPALAMFQAAEPGLRADFPDHEHTRNLDAVIANCLLGADAVAEAIARYRAAVRRNPADVESRLNLAGRLVRDGQWAAAWDTLEAIEAGVQNGTLALSAYGTAILREQQGWTQFWGKKDYAAAAAYFEAASPLAPQRISILEGLAWAYEAPGRHQNRAKSDRAWRELIARYRKNPRIIDQVMSSETARRLKMIH